MKPIHLTVAGLHSFREKQVIDFETLCASGVFGIFGPTGSGKSSLLDAMTLALYGKVERASNNTQGIMNHAENEISVSFTFELGQAADVQRYCVERSYKRSGELSVRSAACRLIQYSRDKGETIVLADKASDIQEKLHELIGLTVDDFTRAVVLPQGKFAEFLSLKGVERRQMLQRLFHLEQYGDQLSERIKVRLAGLKNRLNEITAEQQGLGDASKESLDLLEARVQEIFKKVEALGDERKSFLTEYEQIKSLREWQEQLEKVEESLTHLYSGKEKIEILQEQLAQATEAQQIKPYVEEFEVSAREKENWKAKKLTSRKLCDQAIETEAKRAMQYKQFKEQKDASQPALLERKQLLKQALGLKAELEAKTMELKPVEQELSVEKQVEKDNRAELARLSERLQRAKEKQKQIKEQLLEKKVDFKHKHQLQEAYQLYVQIAQAKQQAEAVQREWDEQQRALEQVNVKRVEAGREQQQYADKLRTNLQQSVLAIQLLEQVISIGEKELQKAQKEVHQLQKKIEQTLEVEWVKKLVDSLQDGTPCPVCGSIEHPNPAEHVTEDVHTLKQTVEEKSKWIENVRNVVQESRFLLHQLQETKTQLDGVQEAEYFPFIQVAEPPSTHEVNEELAATEMERMKREAADTLDLFYTQQMELERFMTDQKSFIQSLKQKLPIWREVSYQLKTALDGAKRIEATKSDLDRKLEQMMSEWSVSFTQVQFESVPEQYAMLQQREQESNELQERLDKSIPFIEETEGTMKQLELQIKDQQLKINEKLSYLSQLEQQMKQLRQKLEELVGQDSIEASIERIDSQLELMSKQEQEAHEQWEAARQALAQAEQAWAVAEESVKQATIRWEKADKLLSQAVGESSFSQWEDVKQAYASKEKLVEWKELIDRYKEKTSALERDKEVLMLKLGARSVTEEEWQDWTSRKQELEQAYEMVMEERGAVQKEFSAMQEKHDRFMKLDKEKERIQKEVEQYGKLQAVFRGNSFVEFMAEEQLVHVCQDASSRLGQLTRQRYALEIDSQGGFIIRDDANGGVRRPVSTLSGGETFLTSLSLALALSAQIQLRGQYPLQFFFLDEGFGTLDPELLDAVVTALENLHLQRLAVGVISHVPELRERLPRKLIVTPAEFSGQGSRVHVETL